MRNTNSFIGSPVQRTEDLRFLRGAGRFIGDLNREGQWHAAVLRSTIAHGRLVSMTRGSSGCPNPCRRHGEGYRHPYRIPFRRPNPSIAPYAQPVIADKIVRCVGEPIAFVLAETEERAEDALPASRSTSNPCPCHDRTSSARRRAPFEGTASNCAPSNPQRRVDEARAAHFRAASNRVQRRTAMPMETVDCSPNGTKRRPVTMSGAAVSSTARPWPP